ncbi:hypothetical protein [Paraburkholderia bannensis]|uniref:hypothetical protein n=1 Tax=Paraburkholderia bannensis TaxID=765414 RepID=UPI002AC367E0|nr:hypothetical protein [Paraburkholderia bannensis]
MKNTIRALLFLLACCHIADATACTIIDVTWYYVREEMINSSDFELNQHIANDIKRTKTIVFKDGPIIGEHHLFNIRGDILYVKEVPSEFIDKSFQYFGNG